MGKEEKKVFICHRYPMLRMVFKRDKTSIIDGAIIREPQEYIGFVKTSYGGVYETSDAAKIEWMRKQPLFLEGEIEEVDAADLQKAIASKEPIDEHPVHAGMVGTMPRTPQPAFAAPEPAVGKAAKAAAVPGRSADPFKA